MSVFAKKFGLMPAHSRASLIAAEKEARSAVVSKSLDPTFDETLELADVTLDEMLASGLTLQVFDKNSLRSDVLLGEVSVSLPARQMAQSRSSSVGAGASQRILL